MKLEFTEEDLFLSTLPPVTRRAFGAIKDFSLLKTGGWYLAGGTALALQAGHRQSVDLDFFTAKKKFQEIALERNLLASGNWVTTFREEGIVYGKFMGAKASFLAYPFFVPAQPFISCGTMRILQASDIAVMKIIAMSQRGRKRDFVDLYWYCQNREPLEDVIARVPVQYPGQQHNIPHFIKSLTYFDDADHDPMPKIFFKAEWSGIKRFFRKEAVAIAKQLLL
jgi:hypothetical protein